MLPRRAIQSPSLHPVFGRQLRRLECPEIPRQARGQARKPSTVKSGLTSRRTRRVIENDEYGAFVRRILHAYARRVGGGDVEALAGT